jgi:RNA polymerase sigma-70 factor (ECF subfamily)
MWRRRRGLPLFVVCLDGDSASRHAAFERFVVPEISRLGRAAQRLTGERTAAEDLVQETLVRAYRSLCRFDGRYPRAWLLTILRHAFLKDVQRQRPSVIVDVTSHDSDPADRVAFDDALARALELLPISQRAVFLLVDVDDHSYAEAAATLGIPEGTVMSRLHRGRRKLREQLVA